MPRITRVKSAQPRYRMVPVLNEDGTPKVTPVLRRNGQPKVKAKTGTPITRRVTQPDKTQPLPNRTCGKCREEINVGDSYVWWANRSPGMRGGSKRYRCAKPECYPKPWETEGNPKRAALMQAEHALEEALSANFESTDEVESAMTDFAETVREIAQEMIDGADNIESGFGHETQTSMDLRERGENLESQADEMESLDLEEPPEADEFNVCPVCEGSGVDDAAEEADTPCEECEGKGTVEENGVNDEGVTYEDAMEEWRDKCREEANDKAGEVDLG